MTTRAAWISKALKAVGETAEIVEDLEQNTSPNIVYRSLRAGENPAAGLVARAPNATGVSPLSHVAGKVQSPWISTSKSLDATVLNHYVKDPHGIVAIDLNRVSSEVVDIGGGIANGGRMSNWARADQEVLIRGSVPAEAIVWSYP